LGVLVLADIHLPYHDRDALLLALKYGLDRKADTILLNGDTADFFAVSHWERDPRKRDLPGEIAAVRTFLEALREGFPKARIIFKLGNHEERWERYLFAKAPEVVGLDIFELGKILEFDDLGIEEVRDMRPIRLGKLNVIHGHEYRFALSNPVNPARGFYLRAKTHVLGAHLHQSSQHTEKSLEGLVIGTWSTGCLCGLHPDYRPLNNWSHGFAFVEVVKDGGFHVANPRIIGGNIYE
jgi:predicted phosphodiesterase